MTFKVQSPISDKSPTREWAEAARNLCETGTFRVKDIKAVLGDPIGGIVVSAAPDRESAYRLAGIRRPCPARLVRHG